MDMTGGYRKLMHELFPQAKIIVDKYHYVRQITYALERVRVEEQKKYSEQWRRYFKRSKYVLLKDTRKLTMEDRLQLDNMFRISKDLYKAYQLKQQFEHVKESSSREEAAKRLSPMDHGCTEKRTYGIHKGVVHLSELEQGNSEFIRIPIY